MLDELTIYNLTIKYPNTIDLIREIERITKTEVINEFYDRLLTSGINSSNYPMNQVNLVKMQMLKEM